MSYMDCCDWDQCTLCGECLMKCPVMQMGEAEAKREFESLLKGEEAPRVFKECTLCYGCNNYCPEGLRPYELILQRISEGRSENPALMPYFINGMPAPNLFQEIYGSLSFGEQEIIRRWSTVPAPTKEIMFVGCVGKSICFDIENSQVLKDLPKFGPSDVCCGELAYRSGAWDAFSDIAERLLARFDELEIERMVCYCASCYTFLSRILPKVYGKELPFQLVSLYEWLLERLRAGELEVKRPLGYSAAVHDSCYTSELGQDFYEVLRELYRAAGVDTLELEHNRDYGLSCGAASIARRWNPLDLMKEQNRKYREVKEAQTKEMALNCPGCFLTLSFTSWMHGIKLHYMVEDLLWAFGDDVSTPLKKRLPLFAKLVTMRSPLALQKVGMPLARIGAK
jgi:Fe-S oxidoreductase